MSLYDKALLRLIGRTEIQRAVSASVDAVLPQYDVK